MESYIYYKSWHYSPSLFSLPIRDGKVSCSYNFNLTCILFSLPIRDGKSGYSSSFSCTDMLFSLPIRDGKLNGGKGDQWGLLAFQPTYKGWKDSLDESVKRLV